MNRQSKEQLFIAIEKPFCLLKASVEKASGFDINRTYSANELKPFDALRDRFIRIVELAIKLFRTHEYYLQAEQSQTLETGYIKWKS
ncbi:MAG: hypothetical protein GQ532_07870 [Methylomarinum sp.]|nr:hypothetical protein [Methylomarinum sp.]